ncbi:OmpA/MotB domain-containing protein [Nitritalea halalkaliphila LW7]|uniref:OmpA/MotB domain-containing protein n=1 Tax=Nitritalea halalkaliphila LW7 TaxID=1189621 RepID=I5CAF7_9BACT|nr:OmpA family protein [Nitritalea halalkaliphila]EIM78809.1 OmpA/MotB domain-containing protein [Nitritalea halalkaliphila LW7]
MKKILLSTLMAGAMAYGAHAQDDFNKWSIEVGGGFNHAATPFSSASFETPLLNLGHAHVGARYMLTEKFGFRADYAFGQFTSSDNSLPFSTNYYRANLQAVANLGRIANFEQFTNRIGLLGHFGAGFGRQTPQDNQFADERDNLYNVMGGFTAQVRLTNRIALTGDISHVITGRNAFTVDGDALVQGRRSIGNWWSATVGLNFYLGSKSQHADWYIAAEKYATKVELAEQIGEIKDMLKDSDGDGIPDYLDKEPNTPAGARVDSFGRTLDSDGDGIPDHLDKCPFVPGPASNDGCPIEEVVETDFFKKAINENYVNVYFAFDSAKPLGFSASAVNHVANFMKRNPEVKLEIKGFADEIGPEDYNMKLSERRAKAVEKLLIEAGIDASRLSAKGFGEDTSVDKKSAEARQLARRTSFEVK